MPTSARVKVALGCKDTIQVRAEVGHAFMLQAGRLQFQPMYSSQVLDHFENPRNFGEDPNPNIRIAWRILRVEIFWS